MELYSFLDLLANAFFGTAVRRVKGVVTAESASAGAYLTIAVRATEPRVDADFLHTTAEFALEVRAVAVETPVIAPREHVAIFCKDTK